MTKKSVRDLSVQGRRVLVRADLNVPLDDHQHITDDRRITQFLPTLRHVLERGGRAVVMSHLGRPLGDPAEDARFSLAPVAAHLSTRLKKPCPLVPASTGPAARDAALGLRDGEVLLLENVRFQKAETIIDKAKKNPDGKLTPEQQAKREAFARGLAELGQCYVNDAFGTCHRKHVSMYDVPLLLPAGQRALGFLVEKELRYLDQALRAPKRPFVALLGGAKVSDKIELIRNLLAKVDAILVGGAMAYTFQAAQGLSVGKSLCERDKLDLARNLLKQAGTKLHLPTDSVAASELKAGAATQVCGVEIPPDYMGLDIGPATVESFCKLLASAGTVVWNGPMGAFETAPFDRGTLAIAIALGEATARGAITIVGGGDSAAAVEKAGLAERMSHISTGGGASLEFLEGKRFETLDAIDDA